MSALSPDSTILVAGARGMVGGALVSRLDVTKLTDLGWTAKTNLDQGIAIAYGDFKSKLRG